LRHSIIAAAAAALLLAACGGGGTSTVPATSTAPGAKSPAQPQAVKIALYIPNLTTTAASSSRRRLNVSGATMSVVVKVAGPTGADLGSSTTDVSPGSAACGGTSGARTCTFYVPAAATASGQVDTFTFLTYDATPVNGAVAASAQLLSLGSVSQAIVANQNNVINAALAGFAKTLRFTPVGTTDSSDQAAFVDVLADGQTHTASYDLSLIDYAGRTIVVSGGDPSNPANASSPFTPTITYSAESNYTGSPVAPPGHTTFVTTPSDLTQPVTVSYDGGGTLTDAPDGGAYRSANNIQINYPYNIPGLGNGQYTAFNSYVDVGVLFVGVTANPAALATTGFSASTGYATGNATSATFTAPGQSLTIGYGTNGPVTITSTCDGVSALGSPAYSGQQSANGSLTISTSGAPGSGLPCTIKFANFSGVSTTLTVNYTTTSSTITIPA
jgi:hypothetical protein